jgi:D-alanine-D-alanine ligase
MSPRIKKKLRVLALFDLGGPTTLDQDFTEELKSEDWQTEANVLNALRSTGYEVDYLAIHDTTDVIGQKLESFPADVIFNLVEAFRNKRSLDQNVASFLELAGIAFTGCGSTGLTLCRNKGISKKILDYHRIRVPQFAILPKGRRTSRPKWLPFPIIIKPLKEEASTGISQASFVESDAEFSERVSYVHEKLEMDVIAEEYIGGREIYVGILGNHRLKAFPMRELLFKEVPDDEPRIATYKAKWDDSYRKKWGIGTRFVEDMDPAVARRIEHTCRRIYRILAMDGYGRIDLRVTPQNEIVFLEANPNPFLARGEDYALSAEKAGLRYRDLISKIVQLGLSAERH